MADLWPEFVRDNPVMAVAFRDFVLFLWEQPDAHQAFQKDTGTAPLREAKCGLDKMIDEATGVGRRYAEHFAEWVIKTQWGEEHGSVRQM